VTLCDLNSQQLAVDLAEALQFVVASPNERSVGCAAARASSSSRSSSVAAWRQRFGRVGTVGVLEGTAVGVLEGTNGDTAGVSTTSPLSRRCMISCARMSAFAISKVKWR
jgi:hypothetical protein